MTAMSMGGTCYSQEEENGRGQVHMETPAGTEQVNALSLFCSLLVVLATELAHSEKEKERARKTERDHIVCLSYAVVFETAAAT